MRFRVDTSAPYDLALPILLAMAAVVAHVLDLGRWVEVPAGLGAVLLAPGYALLAFFFPRRVVVVRHGIERRPLSPLGWMTGSLALSMATGALIGVLLNVAEGGVSAGAFLTANAVVVAVFSGGAMVRRANAPLEERFRLKADWSFTLGGRDGHDKVLMALFVLSGLLVAGGVAYTAFAERDDERFTQFYILGSDGTASCLPSSHGPTGYSVDARQACTGLGNVTVGVVNHEGRATHYWLRGIWTNETAGSARPIANAQEWMIQDFTLDPVPVDLRLGVNFTPQHEIAVDLPPPPGNGTWRLSFQLYRDPPPAVESTPAFLDSPYKRLHLFITVQ